MPKLQVLIATSDEELLFLAESYGHDWLGQLVLTYFCLIHPVPYEHATVVSISKSNQKVVLGCEHDPLDAKFMAIQLLDSRV